jgi:hypothetical protein
MICFFAKEYIDEFTRFSIDAISQLKQLDCIIEQIRQINQSVIIYVCAYGNDIVDHVGVRFLYADMIWISGYNNIEIIKGLFGNNSPIEPSNIGALIDSVEKNQVVLQIIFNPTTSHKLTQIAD